MEQHITPINDIKEHEESSTCPCSPKVTFENGNTIVIHSAFDGRDAMEETIGILEIKGRVQYDVIKLKCPLAYAELKKEYDDDAYGLYLSPNWNGYLSYWEGKNGGAIGNRDWHERELYDFFDKFKFYPVVCKKQSNPISFFHTCEIEDAVNISETIFGERNICEAECFTNLFYELEKMLNVKRND